MTHRPATPLATRNTTRSSSGAYPTKLSHLLAGLIPHTRIRIYPDAAHGFLFQYPTDVAAEVNEFLSANDNLSRQDGSSRIGS